MYLLSSQCMSPTKWGKFSFPCVNQTAVKCVRYDTTCFSQQISSYTMQYDIIYSYHFNDPVGFTVINPFSLKELGFQVSQHSVEFKIQIKCFSTYGLGININQCLSPLFASKHLKSTKGTRSPGHQQDANVRRAPARLQSVLDLLQGQCDK